MINRGAARQTIFHDDRDRVEFERLLGVAHERFGIIVHAYCLMGNHYHLLVECPNGGLSAAMHVIGSTYVRHVNERQGRDGPLFRDRFTALGVRDDAYLMRLVRYIHRNPLAFCEPDELWRYRWSSLRVYLGARRTPSWMRRDLVLDLLGGVSGFEAFVLGDDAAGPAIPVGEWNVAISLMIDEQLGDRARKSSPRTIALLVADRLGDQRGAELLEGLGIASDSARRMALSRARRQAREVDGVTSAVDGVLRLVA